MAGSRLGVGRGAAVVALSALAIGSGLGSARLTYHEAIWAQAAREMAARGDWVVPTLGGTPWLEKPPGALWPVAGLARLVGGVGEFGARLPAAVAGGLLALGVAGLAAQRAGPTAGLLAGLVQASSAWLVVRGRLAEADVPLAAVVVAALAAFDRVRAGGPATRPARWAFFGLLGATALFKGVGFGAALVLATVAAVVAWDRDRASVRALAWPVGWLLAAAIGLAWPALAMGRHPEALGLWAGHVAGRFAATPGAFAGEPWWEYGPSLFWQTLPWLPLALLGARRSWSRAVRERGGPDRLLWCWAVVPAVLVSLARARNGHYLIHALPPWSIWAAEGLVGLGDRLRARGWTEEALRRRAAGLFAGVGLAWAIGCGLVAPRVGRRGAECAFYAYAARRLAPGEPLVLLYDDWDRDPYPTPFGPVPPDLAARLFYLGRPARWCRGTGGFPVAPPCAVIARDRDLPDLGRLGRVEPLTRGPETRWDRVYGLFRIASRSRPATETAETGE